MEKNILMEWNKTSNVIVINKDIKFYDFYYKQGSKLSPEYINSKGDYMLYCGNNITKIIKKEDIYEEYKSIENEIEQLQVTIENLIHESAHLSHELSIITGIKTLTEKSNHVENIHKNETLYQKYCKLILLIEQMKYVNQTFKDTKIWLKKLKNEYKINCDK